MYREATAAAQKAYDRMNEGASASIYQPTMSFTNNQEGIPGTAATDSLKYAEPYDEQQFYSQIVLCGVVLLRICSSTQVTGFCTYFY